MMALGEKPGLETARRDGDRRDEPARGGGRWAAPLVVGGYLLASLALNWRLLPGFTTRMPPVDGNSADGDLFAWYMRYAEHAIAHGHLPALVTAALNAPRGINLMWNTSFLLPSVVLSPVTALAGPQASLNICVIAGFAGSAAAMFWVLRRRRASLLAAGLGGAVFGFSPALLDSAYTHYNLQFALLVPLIADAAMTIVTGEGGTGEGRTWRTGIWLGLLVSAQLFITEEPIADLAVGGLVMTAVLAGSRPRRAWARLPRAAAGFGTAAAVTLALCGYALWTQFAGPLAAHGSPWPNSWYVSSPSALVVPPRGLAFNGGATYQAATWEYLAYLGWPLLAVLLWAGLRYWRDLRIRTLFATWAVLELLALGGAHRWLPFHWLQGLPLLVSLLPDRIPLFADAAAAAILAFGLDLATQPREQDLARKPREQGVAYRRAIPVAVAVLAVLPLLPMPLVPAAAAPAPAGWATVFARLRLAPQARVLVVPVPSQAVPYAIRWQADTGRPGQLPGGWFIGVNPAGHAASTYWGGPPAVRKAVSCLDAFWLTSTPASALPSATGCAAVTRTAVAYWKPDAIVADTSRDSPLGRFLVSVLGQPAVQAGQLLGWSARGRSAGPALPARPGRRYPRGRAGVTRGRARGCRG